MVAACSAVLVKGDCVLGFSFSFKDVLVPVRWIRPPLGLPDLAGFLRLPAHVAPDDHRQAIRVSTPSCSGSSRLIGGEEGRQECYSHGSRLSMTKRIAPDRGESRSRGGTHEVAESGIGGVTRRQ
jgi:hypothetical protein